ncbi:MAG: M48 family metalloprotease [Myxococcaceae bacterium]
MGKTLRATAMLALGLLFFATTLGLVAFLVWLGTEIGSVANELRGRALVLMWLLSLTVYAAAAVVGWSLWPRRTRFKPPGPELKRDLHPALFKELDRVAARCDVKPPSRVYLAPDVNAFVADVGGFAGLFTTRVLGIGLPLLHCLSRAEFRSVLAHEFGHFAGGDTRIGGWVFRTRQAIAGVVTNLGSAADASADADAPFIAMFFALLRWPFLRFGEFYLHASLALSRSQELAADSLAAQLEGVDVLVSSLTRVRTAGLAFDGYLHSEVVPLLEQGVLPPIGPGLGRFLEAKEVDEQLRRVIRELDEEPAHALDSHPPLAQRVAHARALRLGPHRGNPSVEGPAHELLTHLSELELLMAEPWVRGASLKRVPWEKTAPVLEKAWRARAEALRPALAGLTPGALPRDAAQLGPLVARFAGAGALRLTTDRLLLLAASAWSPAITVALLDAGFTLDTAVGAHLEVVRGDERYQPVRLLREWLFTGRDESWLAMWRQAGLEHVALGEDA